MNKVAASLVLALALQLGSVRASNETSSSSEKDFQQVQEAGNALLNLQKQVISDATELKEQLQASNELTGKDAKNFLIKNSLNLTHAEQLMLPNFNTILSIEAKYILKAALACGNDGAIKKSLLESLAMFLKLKLLANKNADLSIMYDYIIDAKIQASDGSDVDEDLKAAIGDIMTQQKITNMSILVLGKIVSLNANITTQLKSCPQAEAKQLSQLIQIVSNIIGSERDGDIEIFAIVADILKALLASQGSSTTTESGLGIGIGAGAGAGGSGGKTSSGGKGA